MLVVKRLYEGYKFKNIALCFKNLYTNVWTALKRSLMRCWKLSSFQISTVWESNINTGFRCSFISSCIHLRSWELLALLWSKPRKVVGHVVGKYFSHKSTHLHNIVINILINKSKQIKIIRTCLWRPSRSISLSTHPILPSPPHTNTRKDSKFWNSRNLQKPIYETLYLITFATCNCLLQLSN